MRGRGRHVGDLGEFLGVLVPVLDEGAVDQDALHDAELGGPRRAQGEADRAAALLDVGLADQVLGGLVGHVVDAGDAVALVDPALVGGVRLHGAVPVEVVRSQVEDGRRVGAQGGRPVELVAGQLHGEHVVLLLAEHRVEEGDADVADGGGAQARRLQDGGEHLDGRGLAVGAGDREPGGRVGLPEPPGEFDVAPHRHPGRARRREQRLVGLPAGGRDDQLGAFGQGVAVAQAHGDAQRLQFGGLFTRPRVVPVVDDGDPRAEPVQHLGRRDAGDSESGDGDVLSLPVGHLSAAHPA
ncbi:hypothetical protein GCM10023238_12720 [Streptomyces heliomycini]